ncbi:MULTISPECIES: hypothetical protein [unclassified Caballeronia]|nr:MULTISPECIES: hypothetical protein [unclassified Caballeronia]
MQPSFSGVTVFEVNDSVTNLITFPEDAPVKRFSIHGRLMLPLALF